MLDLWVSCYLVFLGTKVKKNKEIGTIASWGPTFRVAVDIIVHSAGSGDSSILRFTNKDDENISNHWTRKHIPGIWSPRPFILSVSFVDVKRMIFCHSGS